MNWDIKVTVCIATYNHEKYIRRAIDSVLNQKVDFPIEILVADDCSTDGTPGILKEYEDITPKLNVVFRKKNLWQQPDDNIWLLCNSAQGEYIVLLEGDDFWIDEYKLQKQVAFLDRNKDYIAVAHRCIVVGEESEPINESYPECYDEEYTISHFASNIFPGQTATIMYRNIYHGMQSVDLSVLHKGLIPGDRLLNFVLLCYGRVYCLKDRMSAYRHITTHGSSFSATFKPDFFKDLNWYHELLVYARKNAKRNAVIAVEVYLIAYYRSAIFGANSSNRWIAVKCWLKDNFYLMSYVKYVEGVINRKIFHKTFPIKF